jgi:hypothetical protein
MNATSDIREHMQVVASHGTPLGKVDHLDGDRIKLTRSDSPDGQHHYLPVTCVASVENDQVVLGIPGDEARRMAGC